MLSDSPDKAGEDSSQKELKRLVEAYAMRAREFYEAVAALGGHLAAGRSLEAAIADVKKLRGRCEEAGSQLFDFMTSRAVGASPAAAENTKNHDFPAE